MWSSDFVNHLYDYRPNHNCNKILKSDWLSTVLISALIGQFNGTVRIVHCFFTASKKTLNFLCADKKKGLFFTNFVKVMINW